MDMVTAALTGLGFGLTLIVAIGAQNAFVLRQGLRRSHVAAVVAVCALSDVVLIGAGILGLGVVLDRAPWLLAVLRWGGAVFLIGYAVLALRRAIRPRALDPAESVGGSSSLGAAVLTCLALTWLNPHVYLDTVVLLGSVAATYGDLRWWFGAGAGLGSVAWFTALGFGSRLLGPVFRRPQAWRVLDLAIAVIMGAIAVGLIVGG